MPLTAEKCQRLESVKKSSKSTQAVKVLETASENPTQGAKWDYKTGGHSRRLPKRFSQQTTMLSDICYSMSESNLSLFNWEKSCSAKL